MYRFDKTVFKAQSFAAAEKENLFSESVSLSERLNQAWYLTAMAYGIDPCNPQKMEKKFVGTRKHTK
jgi:hypothetical protein